MSSVTLEIEDWSNLSIEDKYLIQTWFDHLSTTVQHYEEPILDKDTVLITKQMCEVLEQTPPVFILSVEIIEAYLRFKTKTNQRIEDPLLTAVTIIFISHKYVGANDVLYIHSILKLLHDLTAKLYCHKDIVLMEVTVLSTINLPLTTVLDDLDLIVVKCANELCLRADVRPLCLYILEFFYMNRTIWFQELKDTFRETFNSLRVFRRLICSKLCLPVCIFITALKLLNYDEFVDINTCLINVLKFSTIPNAKNLQIIFDKLSKIIQE